MQKIKQTSTKLLVIAITAAAIAAAVTTTGKYCIYAGRRRLFPASHYLSYFIYCR
jgi:hypothetical protein